MADSGQGNKGDDSAVPLLWQGGLVKSGSLNAILLSGFLGSVTIVGLVVSPHWVWAVPLACTGGALAVNYRMRQATRYSQVAILGSVTLVLLIAAGVLVVLIARALR